MLSAFTDIPSLIKKANELRKTEHGLPWTQTSREMRTPWCELEKPAACSGTPLQLSAIHRAGPETLGDQSYISMVCAALSSSTVSS